MDDGTAYLLCAEFIMHLFFLSMLFICVVVIVLAIKATKYYWDKWGPK